MTTTQPMYRTPTKNVRSCRTIGALWTSIRGLPDKPVPANSQAFVIEEWRNDDGEQLVKLQTEQGIVFCKKTRIIL